MNHRLFHLLVVSTTSILLLISCNSAPQSKASTTLEQFADLKVIQYEIPGFEQLSLKQKKLVYYLSQAGLEGRDIMYDQNYRHNLSIRIAFENIYQNYTGDKTTALWGYFEKYLKRLWFSNGIHHHYSNDKFDPEFTAEELNMLMEATNTTLDPLAFEAIFSDSDSKKVNRDPKLDVIQHSAINFYAPDVTQAEVENYYKQIEIENPERPISMGLNSTLVKENGQLVEKVWKVGGLYSPAIERIVGWLEKAITVAENEQQAEAFSLLIDYYKTGDLKIWDDYSIAWVKTLEGDIDYINGFIEVYNDPLGYRGSFESIVQIKDFNMSEKMQLISQNAQWFEDNSSIMEEHKKKNVVGIAYNTVNVASEAGDASPYTPIGVNLPNANWIRAQYGSKSVSLGNIIYAYANSGATGRLEEFAYNQEEIDIAKNYGYEASRLHTSLHEVIGHASGQLMPGVATPKETLKSYASSLEEARADLVALYFMGDSQLNEFGIKTAVEDLQKAEYNSYIRNGLMLQLIRIKLGEDIEQSHMRNRQMVAQWVFKKGLSEQVIEKKIKDGKTFFVINDYQKLRILFGILLREVQRIKSEGDYAAGKELIETYGVKIDLTLHKEILDRNAQFSSAPYGGFINPVLVPLYNDSGEIIDVQVSYPNSFTDQMLHYSATYNALSATN